MENNFEEMEDIEIIEADESLLPRDKYVKTRKTLIKICNECNIPEKKYLDQFPKELPEDMSVMEVKKNIALVSEVVRELVNTHYFKNWETSVDDYFEVCQTDVIKKILETMVRCDSPNAYDCLSQTISLLTSLNDEKKKSVTLKRIERFSENNSIADVSNTLCLLQYSKFRKEIIKACANGFNKNGRVNNENAAAVFGGCEPGE